MGEAKAQRTNCFYNSTHIFLLYTLLSSRRQNFLSFTVVCFCCKVVKIFGQRDIIFIVFPSGADRFQFVFEFEAFFVGSIFLLCWKVNPILFLLVFYNRILLSSYAKYFLNCFLHLWTKSLIKIVLNQKTSIKVIQDA